MMNINSISDAMLFSVNRDVVPLHIWTKVHKFLHMYTNERSVDFTIVVCPLLWQCQYWLAAQQGGAHRIDQGGTILTGMTPWGRTPLVDWGLAVGLLLTLTPSACDLLVLSFSFCHPEFCWTASWKEAMAALTCFSGCDVYISLVTRIEGPRCNSGWGQQMRPCILEFRNQQIKNRGMKDV